MGRMIDTDKSACPEHALAKGEGLDASAIPDPAEVNAAWCLRFLRSIRDVAFATVDEQGLPAVRVIDVMAVSDRELYFLAPRGKAFHVDVMREGCVAIVGQTPDYRTCRLRGRAVRAAEAEQRDLVDLMFSLNPGMETIYPGDARYICDVFFVAEGEGEYFDLGQKPVFRKSFALGVELDVGCRQVYAIAEGCIGCGLCTAVCPEQCISSGAPYIIDQAHCLRCGLCVEACPMGAIIRGD